MSKGFCFVAQNNDSTDYVRQACILAVSIHKFNKGQNISIVTNDKIPNKYHVLFDKIIPIETDDAVNEKKKMHGRARGPQPRPPEWMAADLQSILLPCIFGRQTFAQN